MMAVISNESRRCQSGSRKKAKANTGTQEGATGTNTCTVVEFELWREILCCDAYFHLTSISQLTGSNPRRTSQ